VQLLRRKAAASQHLTTSLLAESSQNEAMIAQLKAVTSPRSQREADKQPNLSFLNSSPSSRAFNISTEQPMQRPLTTNTTFTLSQLPALRALLAELRPKIASLQSAELGFNSARDERRQERRDYIEQRTRMHLDRNRRAYGDNNVSVNGRKVDTEEVEALEVSKGILMLSLSLD
jgi:kinetochore protein Mis12/MTW1